MILVPRERVLDIWHVAEPLVKRALEYGHGEYDHIDTLRFLLTLDPSGYGVYQLWVSEDHTGCFITQILQFPKTRALKIVMLAGDGAIRGWMSTGSRCVEEFSKMIGASWIEWSGRFGWEKIAEKYGYERAHITMRKTIGVEHAGRS